MADRILVWGAGAIGAVVAAYLKRAGHDVTLVDIVPDHVAAISDPAIGLSITGGVDNFTISIPAFAPGTVQGVWEHVYLCVKSQHTYAATKMLEPHLAPDGYVLSLQNGLCEEIIAGVVGKERVIGAFINFGADWLGPGRVEFGNRGAFVVGELDGLQTDRLTHLLATIQDFEPNAVATDNIAGYLWGKLSYSSMLFASALGDLGMADCLARPELLGLWRRIGREVNEVAAAIKVKPVGFNGYVPEAFKAGSDEDTAKAAIDRVVAFHRASPKTHTGVWRDLAIRKRKTEVDTIVAPIAAIGARHSIACPTISRLVTMIHEIEEGKRMLFDRNLDELAAS